jgi:lipid II:glycine glycyltransferase (peptidoglycan interpeptide bridge formation enzyme)
MSKRSLDPEFSAEFQHIDEESWYGYIRNFEDSNLYQTRSYDVVKYGRKRTAHLVLRKRSGVVAVAQARILSLPFLNIGIAYVFWGPLWRLRDTNEDTEVFRQAIRALRNELAIRRGLVLRLNPLAVRGKDDILAQILADEGFDQCANSSQRRTLIIDLSPPLKDIRSALDQKWRNCLNKAERNQLVIAEGDDDRMFDDIVKMYSEMARRKGLNDVTDLEHLRNVQKRLPSDLKLRVVSCRDKGELCAGGIFSAMGNGALYLVGATSNSGMKSNGSYLVQWAFIQWLKERGGRYYDLNGINPESNPGTYHFKRGLAGKLGQDVELLGKYQVPGNFASDTIVRGGEKLLSTFKKIPRQMRLAHDRLKSMTVSRTHVDD